LLNANLDHPGHRFWADEIGLREALQCCHERLVGHRQVTDAYLLGLALHRKGTLATLDESVTSLLPDGGPERASVEVIRGLS
jgi:predicted nucleic acid-binding protein